MIENIYDTEKILSVISHYNKIGTISGVAKELNIDFNKVKKYLRQGHRLNLFYFNKYYKKKKTEKCSKRKKIEKCSNKTLKTHPKNILSYHKIINLYKKYNSIDKVAEKLRTTPGAISSRLHTSTKKGIINFTELKKQAKIIRLTKLTENCKYLCEKYNVIKLFGKYGSIGKISKATGIAYFQVQNCLFSYYKCNSYAELKKIFPVSENKRKIIMEAKELYEKYHSFPRVGNDMGISVVQIKNLLHQGEKYNLFKYNDLIKKDDTPSGDEKNTIIKIKELYEKHHSIPKVAKKINLSENKIRNILKKGEYYNLFKFNELKKKVHLFSEDKIDRIKMAKQLYDKYHSLDKVGINMKISKERVRQLLKLGEKFYLFEYKTYGKTRFEELRRHYDKTCIVRAIKENKGL
ncbi:MAG: hypothetical protein Q7K21_04815, partial [Elusimicrobiota bacterium]|nr:hypothetical protein [Elusimicrobiota bacterium]